MFLNIYCFIFFNLKTSIEKQGQMVSKTLFGYGEKVEGVQTELGFFL